MKNPLFKSIVILGSALALLSCSDEATDAINQAQDAINEGIANAQTQGSDPAWRLDADQPYLIYPSGVVTDASGNVIGTFAMAEGTTTGTMYALDNTVLLEGVDTATLPVTTRDEVNTPIVPASSASLPGVSSETLPGVSSASLPGVSSETLQPNSSSATAVSSSSKQEEKSSSSVQVQTNGNVTVTGNLTQTVAQGNKTSVITFSGVSSSEKAVRKSWNAYFLNTEFNDGVFTIKATTVPDYFQTGSTTETFEVEGKSYEFKLNVTAGSGQSNDEKSSSSIKSSSSSKVKSSSSVRSSSSVKSSSSQGSSNLSGDEAKYVDAGKGGKQGWATRYWDCCKPHCAWPGKGGLQARSCNASGSKVGENTSSMCDGGDAGICMEQIPIVVSDKLAYAFAAVPAADGGKCGKCFALTFTGKGKYETKGNHKALEGKTLVVMASNIGGDVSAGQFDIMIPGGGVGIFNGCSKMGWPSSMGAQYGGLLSDCESEVGYAGDLLSKRKECLTKKCNSVFANHSQAREGCLFLATWMEAAGNPSHEYKEVECPQALKAKY